ncbi:hypothetical protein F5X99DRAFT_429477 [Biscogniauxia marginata]|nr:hypothetical protein F5X99DRAFT_429477 [Biscogniauxia marginata]
MASVVANDVIQEVHAPSRLPAIQVAVDTLSKHRKSSQQTTPPVTPPVTPPISCTGDSDSVRSLRLSDFSKVDQNEEPLVAVIGCGYVGTHLISAFSSQYDVLGFDVSESQLERVKQEYGGEESRMKFTLDPRDLTKATHFLVSVPTLLQADQTVSTSYISSALSSIATYARNGATIVIESSVAVGMTRQLVGPMAKERGFFVGMSPERVDPGRTEPPMRAIPKIVSGLDDIVPGSLDAITRLYSRVFDSIIPVANPETAEMTKLYENCQRMICIAYANEMADACIGHAIDPYEVCKAAASKPFGYLPFSPGLGVGGHCIPVNPYYLFSNNSFPLLQAATEKMWQRPAEIGQRAIDTLIERRVSEDKDSSRPPLAQQDSAIDMSADQIDLHLSNPGNNLTLGNAGVKTPDLTSDVPATGTGSDDPTSTVVSQPRVLVVGVGFKAGQSTMSNSPGLKLIQKLADSGHVEVMFADSLVEQSAIPQIPRLDMDQWNKEHLETFDMIVVAFKQTGMDFSILDQLENTEIQIWCP